MNDDKIIANQTEVYIFSKYGFDTKPKMKGIIIKSKNSGDLSEHGSSWSVPIYEVLGDDGLNYYGVHGENFLYDNYFRTKQNYIKYLNGLIKHNNYEIDKLKENNIELEKIIENESLNKSEERVKRLIYEKK